VWNFVNHFRQPGVGANWKSLPQWFKEHNYTTLASGKLYHPSHPPNDDYPTSWTTAPDINPWYWGNQLPIGDADSCAFSGPTGLNMTAPLRAKFNNGLVCTLIPFECLLFPSIPSSVPQKIPLFSFPLALRFFPRVVDTNSCSWIQLANLPTRGAPDPVQDQRLSNLSASTLWGHQQLWAGRGGYSYLRDC
jgi:hypothetical protein